ncbi:MAG: DNA mismatch endonuclease Vsr [Desulfobacterales bacterium]|nr:DNA mismatch endonuclease Vsr [Desulfobacterales bacterium]
MAADTFDKTKRSTIMRAVKSKNTSPEMFVRRVIYSKGYRYRLHVKELRGSPDIVFPRYKTVVFVNGCYWHGHGCSRSRIPKTNSEYWLAKIHKNMDRDEKNLQLLSSKGWTALTIWEFRQVFGMATRLENQTWC